MLETVFTRAAGLSGNPQARGRCPASAQRGHSELGTQAKCWYTAMGWVWWHHPRGPALPEGTQDQQQP